MVVPLCSKTENRKKCLYNVTLSLVDVYQLIKKIQYVVYS